MSDEGNEKKRPVLNVQDCLRWEFINGDKDEQGRVNIWPVIRSVAREVGAFIALATKDPEQQRLILQGFFNETGKSTATAHEFTINIDEEVKNQSWKH